MAIRPDQRYDGVVIQGSMPVITQTGTPGYQVMLECAEGHTSFMIWLTEKNRARAEKTFTDVLGIPVEKLGDEAFFEYDLGIKIQGIEVTFGTREETYKGKTTVKVAWLGKRSSGNPAKEVAGFFGKKNGKTETPKPLIDSGPITDDDVPF